MLKFNNQFFGEEMRDSARRLEEDCLNNLHLLIRKECLGKEWTGWMNWPKLRGFEALKRIKNHITLLGQPYDTVVVVGIGGSYLGAKAIHQALSHRYIESLAFGGIEQPVKPIVFAGHNLSETELIELFDYLDHRSPIVNVISKTGSTTEPGVAFRVLKNYMEARYGKELASRRMIITTDPKKGALRALAEQNGYHTFDVPSDVGGRFSVLTAVGLVPLCLAGHKVESLLKGADRFFSSLYLGAHEGTLERLDAYDAVRYAAARMAAWNSGYRIELMSYGEPKLATLIEWWKQLFGESEGKDGKGLFPAGLNCTTDLHSLGQYVQDGVRNILETFLYVGEVRCTGNHNIERSLRVPQGNAVDELEYLEGEFISTINRAALKATEVAHHDGGVPCLQLHLTTVSEESLGYLCAFMQTACAISALTLGVNPFDQPGVESYKINLFGMMGKPGFEQAKMKMQGLN
jgi:glucose-6-phosphate isomerase